MRMCLCLPAPCVYCSPSAWLLPREI
uniref:Uncharacterized protein n=1 Tax=Anguilla anguilla TaxID=7936 RepID=A0A0E9R232_ANGAN